MPPIELETQESGWRTRSKTKDGRTGSCEGRGQKTDVSAQTESDFLFPPPFFFYSSTQRVAWGPSTLGRASGLTQPMDSPSGDHYVPSHPPSPPRFTGSPGPAKPSSGSLVTEVWPHSFGLRLSREVSQQPSIPKVASDIKLKAHEHARRPLFFFFSSFH